MSHKNNVAKFSTHRESKKAAAQIGKTKKFHVNDLKSIQPKTTNQTRFFEEVNRDIPIIANFGTAGTGKTFLALYAALSQVLDPSTPYFKVVVCRSLVEVRKSGFLPGTLEEKYEPYEATYRNAVSEMFKEFKQPYELLKELGYLEFLPTNFVRGQTLDNCILVVDEIQNMDKAEIYTVLTRIGIESKIILCGDSKQDDLGRHREQSGFGYLNKLIESMDHGVASTIVYTPEDIVRSGLAREIILADENIVD